MQNKAIQVNVESVDKAGVISSLMQSNTFLSDFTVLLSTEIQKDVSISSKYSVKAVALSEPKVEHLDSTGIWRKSTDKDQTIRDLVVVIVVVLAVLLAVVVGGCTFGSQYPIEIRNE